MDPLAIVLLAVLAAGALCVWIAARGDGAAAARQPPGVRSAREIVAEREALEGEDLGQLLEATNARRRARGLPERSADDAELEFGRFGPSGPGTRGVTDA
ncbi:MAG: hypothetical protein ACRDMJ_07930 [Solirubrobacteraceae bacterium]